MVKEPYIFLSNGKLTAFFKGVGGAVWTKSANEQVAIVFGGYYSWPMNKKTFSFNAATGKFVEEPGLELPFSLYFLNPYVQTVDGAVYAQGVDYTSVYTPQGTRGDNIAILLVLEKYGTAWTVVDKTRMTNTGYTSGDPAKYIHRPFLISSWNPPKLLNP